MSNAVTNVFMQAVLTVTEQSSLLPSGIDARQDFAQFNQSIILSSGGTPAVAKLLTYITTISGGGYDIDLTAGQGTGGTLDCSGKKIRAILIVNPGGNPMTIAPGGSNGHAINGGQPLKCEASGGIVLYYPRDGLAAVDGTHKILTVAGTNGDAPEIAILLG